MIDTNQMKIHFDHSAIARDFAIYEIRRDSGNYYQSKIPDFALEECHARAVAYEYGSTCYILYARNEAEKHALKQKLESCESDFCIHEISSQQLAETGQHLLAQLLCNAIPSFKTNHAEFHNLTGKLYCQDAAWTRQRKDFLVGFWALEISFTRDCCIRLRVQTFRNTRLGMNDSGKAQYLFDPKHYVLRRALYSERQEPGDRFVQGAYHPKRKNNIPFLLFGSLTEYQKCKIGVLHCFLQDVQQFLSAYIQLTPVALDENQHASTACPTESMDTIRQRIQSVRLFWEDTVQNEQSAALLSLLQQELLQYSGVTLQDGVPQKGDALLRIIHHQAYYEDCPEQDPYPHAPRDCIVQHITAEDFQLTGKNQRCSQPKENYNLRKILQELAIKIDVFQRRMTCYPWPALGFSAPVSFVMAEAKDKKPSRFYMLRVYPNGALSFHTWEQNLLENTTEQEKIAQRFTTASGYFDRSVQGLIFEDEDNIHTIYDTDLFTLPNMQALEQLLRKTPDDEILSTQPIAEAIQEYTVSASEKEKESCKQKLLAIEQCGKLASRKQLRQLLNVRTKLGKQLNMFIFDRTGILIGDNKKSKENRERLFGGVLGIRHFIRDDAQYYYSGYVDKALNRSLPHACRIRKVCSTGHILHFERYLPLLEVDFVRASGWTVLPFPFKYLREWMAKQH